MIDLKVKNVVRRGIFSLDMNVYQFILCHNFWPYMSDAHIENSYKSSSSYFYAINSRYTLVGFKVATAIEYVI